MIAQWIKDGRIWKTKKVLRITADGQWVVFKDGTYTHIVNVTLIEDT